MYSLGLSGKEKKTHCLLCNKVLASSSLNHCKLKRHLKTHYLNSKKNPANFFKCYDYNLETSGLDSIGKLLKNTAALKGSYKVAKEIAVAKKPYNVGKLLIMPCTKRITSNLPNNSEIEKLK